MTRLGSAAWAIPGAPAAVEWRAARDAQLAALHAALDPSHPLPADVDPSADDRAEAAAEARAWCSDKESDNWCGLDENRTVRGAA